LLPGEDVLLRCEFIAWLVSPSKSIVGTLLITTGATRFTPATVGNPKLTDRERRGWKVYHGNVHRVLRLGSVSANAAMHAFEIICKTPWAVRISTNEPDMENKIWNLLEHIVFRAEFAILHCQAVLKQNPLLAASGWSCYDPLAEYKRMGVLSSTRWRVTEANSDYKLCSTYPKFIVVPRLITDDEVRLIAKFRSKGRMPAVVYLHPNQAVLARCAQPRTGLRGTRCEADEKFFLMTLQATLDPRQPLRLMDARPHLNAVANTLMGAGYEREGVYENCKRKFLNIENIHVMRTSLNKLRQLCASAAADGSTGAELDSRIGSTGWFDHLALILQATQKCVDYIRQGHSVILHCSDGWDRTPQLTGLTQLCLDPHFRTIRGFVDLVEKEWCSFGHMFRKRCGHGSSNWADKERSPVRWFLKGWAQFSLYMQIFTQFLDTVFQVITQYPTVCEFNERFLVALARHLFSCRYGTFLPSTDEARIQLAPSTLSVWSRLELPGK
jgi:myotubularin-related protein 1/2